MKTLWLIVYLDATLKIRLVLSERESIIPDYSPLTLFPGSTGHYDWLRNTSGQIVGVRYWPFKDEIHDSAILLLRKKCFSLGYSHVDADSRFFSIFWGAIEDIDESISNDQDMGENGIYSDSNGRIALCFEVDNELEKTMPNEARE
jgi:hypothetical protein